MKKEYKSPFLDNRERIFENEIGFVIYDGYPVSKGHCLIIPNRVYPDYFESTPEEIKGLNELIFMTKEFLDKEYKPSGYNIGVNCGEDSGQTVFHLHIHLIPRYKGDVEDPRGGVRGVIPSKQKY
jgi:diadenosine tetraphosphate (Ap4A) HIT family hydrolase